MKGDESIVLEAIGVSPLVFMVVKMGLKMELQFMKKVLDVNAWILKYFNKEQKKMFETLSWRKHWAGIV